MNLEDASDPVMIAKLNGFIEAQIYTGKQSGKLFTLTSVSGLGAVFQERTLLLGVPDRKTVDFTCSVSRMRRFSETFCVARSSQPWLKLVQISSLNMKMVVWSTS